MLLSANVVVFILLIALQSLPVAAQMRPRAGGSGMPGHPGESRTEEFMRKASQEQSEQELIRRAQLVVSGAHIEIYQDGLVVDPQFLAVTEDAYGKLEELTGRKFDTAVLGPKVRVFVSTQIGISHVWRGYEHPKDPKGIVFLNRRVYAGAMAGTDATFIHEMSHLLTWKFYSHTLREGIANYLAQRIRPGAGSGANPAGYDWSVKVPKAMASYLGTTKEAPQMMTGEPESRGVYYYACYRFVKHLVDAAGMEVFMKLYESRKPEDEFPKLYGATRKELIAAAGM